MCCSLLYLQPHCLFLRIKKAPDVALERFWGVKSTLFLQPPAWALPLYFCSLLNQANQQDGQFNVWVHLLIFWWTPLPIWPLVTLQSLTAAGVSGHCVHCFPVSTGLRCLSAISLFSPISLIGPSLFYPGQWFSVCLAMSLPYSAILSDQWWLLKKGILFKLLSYYFCCNSLRCLISFYVRKIYWTWGFLISWLSDIGNTIIYDI